jgi:hypothetical protein
MFDHMDGTPGRGLPEAWMEHRAFIRALAALLLFGVSFGYVEAAVVVYLGALYRPLHQKLYPESGPHDLFPVIPPERLRAEQPELAPYVVTELVREAATLLMLVAVGLAVARNGRQWLAAFAIAFGLWDIFYYVFLNVLVGWPDSLLAWDLLFLLPVPWAGPVLAPVLIALSLVGGGTLVLRQEYAGRPFRLARLHWVVLLGGGLVVITAFCWDFRSTLAGGVPTEFNWPLFALGEALGLAAFLHAFSGSLRGGEPSPAAQTHRPAATACASGSPPTDA